MEVIVSCPGKTSFIPCCLAVPEFPGMGEMEKAGRKCITHHPGPNMPRAGIEPCDPIPRITKLWPPARVRLGHRIS